ncbi:hypothetical protein [Pseudonocardia sp.]|jgi:hypothetical protein|uniref:hypothetical protein n=1 Tax=Pseudonocardia sp. TaxID=60912 RepID=UPI0026119921|nr:hypothetical protein [Pseudonocardia sp.]MCW2719910.1 hypothetical protein [Pseudonocardia sp.]MDT7615416.1 hypothetical protein [Pseudonocardiales bacterium]
MRVTLDLFRATDGRLEGTVHGPGATGGTFASLLDLLRVLEGLDLSRRETRTADDEPAPDTEGTDDRPPGG